MVQAAQLQLFSELEQIKNKLVKLRKERKKARKWRTENFQFHSQNPPASTIVITSSNFDWT